MSFSFQEIHTGAEREGIPINILRGHLDIASLTVNATVKLTASVIVFQA